MFGFCDGCCAFAGAIVANAAANDPIKPSKIFLPTMVEAFPYVRFKNANASFCPCIASAPGALFATQSSLDFEKCRLAEGAIKAT